MDYIVQKTQRKVKLEKKKSKNVASVKTTHKNKMLYFDNLQTKVLKEKKQQLSIVKNNQEKKTLLSEIEDIEGRVEELDYFFKTSRILDEYFLLDDNLQYDTPDINGNTRKMELVREYYHVLDMVDIPLIYQYKNGIISYRCTNCNSNDIIETEEGDVCRECGIVLEKINFAKDLSYKEKIEGNYQSKIDYKRVDYFKQWLNQIQAKEQTEIPQDVIDSIMMQIKIERVKNISKINNVTMKKILKKTNNSRYYEHIPYIINIINNVKPLNIEEHIEEKLIAMFLEIQIPWEELKTKDRKNFFSYPYTIHKFCQILYLDDYLPYFPLLKSREKLYKQDVIWKKIMEYFKTHECINKTLLYDVNWRFISSF